jgi:hypothetical protein
MDYSQCNALDLGRINDNSSLSKISEDFVCAFDFTYKYSMDGTTRFKSWKRCGVAFEIHNT